MENLTPSAIVAELDRYIIGQREAKRAVAVALRNRYRRKLLPPEMQEEIAPKNILMIGPTGVGKTEIARRLAKLVNAPFVKVEATKFTEVGYVGRDVESMIRDLVEVAIRMVRMEKMVQVEEKAKEAAEKRLLDVLLPKPRKPALQKNPFEALFGGFNNAEHDEEEKPPEDEKRVQRQELAKRLAAGELENMMVEIEVEDNVSPMVEVFSGTGMEEMGINLQDIFGGLFPKRKKLRKVTVAAARKILIQEEAAKLIDMDEVTQEAIARAEQTGIIFIDEIDKIAAKGQSYGPDVSREGVQRDILPIVEGSTVVTKYGPIKTDYILFIAAGAFHVSKPSDLIPELQGRFPIRVELTSLSEEDFKKILNEPQNALVKQYTALLSTEGIQLNFTEDGIAEIARCARDLNERTENIGARRLHTILERVLQDISFSAPDLGAQTITIDKAYVQEKLQGIVKDQNLSRFIL